MDAQVRSSIDRISWHARIQDATNGNKEIADKAFGRSTDGLFGDSHLTGGYAGVQAEYVRVPYAE